MASSFFVGTIAEAAKIAGVSYSTMYHRIKRKTIESYRLHPACVVCVCQRRRRLSCRRCSLLMRKRLMWNGRA